MNRGRYRSKAAFNDSIGGTTTSEFRNLNPSALLIRLKQRGHHAAHLESVVKSWIDRFCGVDGFEEIAGLDDDLGGVTGAMSGSFAESAKIRVFRPHEQLREALTAATGGCVVEPQRVLVFRVEPQSALRPRDVIGI